MREILVSSGAFIGRPNGREWRLFFDVCNGVECDGFEFMMYNDWYPDIDEITDTVASRCTDIKTFHADKLIGELSTQGEFDEAVRRMRINAASAARLGAEKVVLHLWNGKISDTNFKNNIKAFPRLYEACAEQGVLLAPENVVCALGSPIGRIAELAHTYDFAKFTFDIKMSAFHRELDRVYSDEMCFLWDEGRIAHVHVNDYRGEYMDFSSLKTLHIGKGDVDFERFADFLDAHGYDDTITLECGSLTPEGKMCFDDMNESVRRARELFTENK